MDDARTRILKFNDYATHDHIVFSVTNTHVRMSFNSERYNVKTTMAADSLSQFSLSIQEPITGLIWEYIEKLENEGKDKQIIDELKEILKDGAKVKDKTLGSYERSSLSL